MEPRPANRTGSASDRLGKHRRSDADQPGPDILLADWGCDDPVNGCEGDLNGDDKTDQSDLGILLADWGCGT